MKEFTRDTYDEDYGRSSYHDELENWDEELAKEEKRLCCHDCRYFDYQCHNYVGMYHKTCDEFEWW